MQIVLTRSQKKVKIVIDSGAIIASRGLSSRARHRRPVTVSFSITAADARGLRTPLRLRVKSRR